jgi:thermitase
MKKNIFKKVVLLLVLGGVVTNSFPALFNNNLSNTNSSKKLQNRTTLVESDKIQLNKQVSYFGGEVRANADSEIIDFIVPGELLVKFKDITTKESFIRENVGDSSINPSLVTKISTPTTGNDSEDKTNTLNLVDRLKNDSRISWAEPNIIVRRSFVPNDTKYSDQWALKNTGQNTLAFYDPFPTVVFPTPGFDIKAEQAWDISQGNGTVIAVIDDGIDYSHPDLLPNIYRDASGRIIGKNIGDNCFFSNIDGSDNTNCNYRTNPLDPKYGHGTAVAGAAAAKGNNSSGIIGACPNCKIMPIGLESLAEGPNSLNTGNIYDGMVYAINNGADIINLSLGYNTYVESISDLIDFAFANDIVVVASSGNCGIAEEVGSFGCVTQNQLEYPASYPKVISVSGSNPDGKKTDFATINSMVDITGPARNIWTTWSQYVPQNCGSGAVLSGSSYLCIENGTSFSAPITAGVIGLIIGQNPNLTYSQIEIKLKTGASNAYLLNPGLVGLMGVGNVNACGSLTGCTTNPSSSSSSVVSSSSSSQSRTFLGNINVNLCQGNTGPSTLNLTLAFSTNELNLVSQSYPSGFISTYINTPGNLEIIYQPNLGSIANLGTISGTYNLVVQESNNQGNVGNQKEYNLIFNVNNCTTSSSSQIALSSSSTSQNISSSSLVQSSILPISSSSLSSLSLIAASSIAASSSMTASSSIVQSSTSSAISSSLLSSSVLSSSATSSSLIQYSFGSFFPNATLTGAVGSAFPVFSLSGCNLPVGATPVTLSSGINSIGGTISNCMFTPNAATNILPTFQSSTTLSINAVGIPSIVIPISFSLPVASSSLISSSILSSSISSSSQFSSSIVSSSQNQISSSSILPTVVITGVNIIGSQYQINFTPNGYVPLLGGIHTHFYYNTEPNTITNKMYSGSSPYLLDISTKPANATQICAIVANSNHTIINNSGNCYNLPVILQISSISSSSSRSSSLISSSSLITSSSISNSLSSNQTSSNTGIAVTANNSGGSINISDVDKLISSSITSASSKSSITNNSSDSFSKTKLDSKDELGSKNGEVTLQLDGVGECSKPIEASIKTTKEQNIRDFGNIYPFGVVNFKVKCSTEVKVKLYFPMVNNWNDYKLRKLIFDKNNVAYKWEDYKTNNSFEIVNGLKVATSEFIIKDGEYGDITAKDGYIVDPIGLVKLDNSKSNIQSNKSSENDNNDGIGQFILARTGGVDPLNVTLLVLSAVLVLSFFINKLKEEK